MTSHKRGGTYILKIMTDVRNWSGELLDREILHTLQNEDKVRVIFEPNGESRYITITDVFSNGYFKGYIADNYNNRYCNICNKEGIIKGSPLHYCENWMCSFDCHLNCLSKHPDMICNCNKNIFKIVKWKQYLLNGSIIIFKKNNISEIPNWSKNTEKMIELYKC